MLVIGWGLIPITLFHVVPFSLSAFSWRELLPSASRPNTVTIIGIRWIRESINSLLPVASIGGDVASMRLVHLGGVPSAQAASSVVVDTTLGVITQLIFVLSGVGLLLMRSTDHTSLLVARTVLIAMGVLFLAITAFVFFQHRGLFAAFARFARPLGPGKWLAALAIRASMVDDSVVTAGDAYVLESLGSGVRAATFMVPGALGALEGSYVLFGAMFGLPADMALAIFPVQTRPGIGVGCAGPAALAAYRRSLSCAPWR